MYSTRLRAGRFLFVLLLYVAAAVVLPEGALISMLDNNNYQDPCDVACHYMALQMTKCWTEFDSPLSSLSILFPSLKYLYMVCLEKKTNSVKLSGLRHQSRKQTVSGSNSGEVVIYSAIY